MNEQAMNSSEVNRISMLALAHVGDAVYELLVRSMLCRKKHAVVMDLHRQTVSYVNASAQAGAIEKLMPVLDEEEKSVFRRGRNTKVNSVPHNADLADYHTATGLEALFGWLYLLGREDRIFELFHIITDEGDFPCR